MSMKEWLIRRIKKAGENIESTIIQLLFWMIVGGPIFFVAISKEALSFSLQIANIPTPLWATTALIVLCCLYTYVKAAKILSKLNQVGQASESPPYETKDFTIGKFKWKTDIFQNNDFDVHPIPYCVTHGTKLVYAETHYACPAIQLGCESMIEKDNLITNHEAAKSFIEYLINKK